MGPCSEVTLRSTKRPHHVTPDHERPGHHGVGRLRRRRLLRGRHRHRHRQGPAAAPLSGRPHHRRLRDSTSCPAASTSTRISTCRSAARPRPTTSRRGTIAAAFGGTTCLVDFAIQYRGQTMRHALDDWMKQGLRQGGDRLLVPHDRHRAARRRARRHGPHGPRRRDHQLQAVHGLSRRLHGGRRDDLPRAAAGPARTAGSSACTPRTAA